MRKNIWLNDALSKRIAEFEKTHKVSWSQVASKAFTEYMDNYNKNRLKDIDFEIQRLLKEQKSLTEPRGNE